MRNTIIFSIKIYQKILSPQTGVFKILYFSPIISLTPGQPGCRHSTTCSQYAIERLNEEKNIYSAVNLSLRRIINCHL